MEEDCHHFACKESLFDNLRRHVQIPRGHECPLSRQELGYYSWSFLHTFAAYYPLTPTDQQRTAMKGILEGFRELYPCGHCRSHFQRDYDRDPPRIENGQEVSLWVCRQHNLVNQMLGKPVFECKYSNLLKRWKNGCSKTSL